MNYVFTDIPPGMEARAWRTAVEPPKRRFRVRSLLRYIATRVRP